MFRALLGGPRFENAMNAADTAWRRPPRPPRPRFRATSILPALTIFLIANLQISAFNSLHEHENRNSDLYCNKTLVSTSQCSLRTKIPLCHNGTHASSQLRALTPPEHFSTPLLETLPTTLHEISFMRLPAYWPPHALAQHTDARTFPQRSYKGTTHDHSSIDRLEAPMTAQKVRSSPHPQSDAHTAHCLPHPATTLANKLPMIPMAPASTTHDDRTDILTTKTTSANCTECLAAKFQAKNTTKPRTTELTDQLLKASDS